MDKDALFLVESVFNQSFKTRKFYRLIEKDGWIFVFDGRGKGKSEGVKLSLAKRKYLKDLIRVAQANIYEKPTCILHTKNLLY